MCPLRFLLVFASLIVAAYVAFKSLWILNTEVEKEGEEVAILEESTEDPPTDLNREVEGDLRLVSVFFASLIALRFNEGSSAQQIFTYTFTHSLTIHIWMHVGKCVLIMYVCIQYVCIHVWVYVYIYVYMHIYAGICTCISHILVSLHMYYLQICVCMACIFPLCFSFFLSSDFT